MDDKHKGALAELKAASWLLSQGYEVFRNVSPFGAVDLISMDPETHELNLIDVKTIPNGQVKTKALANRIKPGVRLLAFDPKQESFELF